MNSLNFINKEIKATQKSYAAFDLDYMLFGRESDKKEYERLLKKLKHLQQVKAELEAWEICKNDPVILSTIKTLAEGESINWHRLPEEQRESIKKVIEVEND